MSPCKTEQNITHDIIANKVWGLPLVTVNTHTFMNWSKDLEARELPLKRVAGLPAWRESERLQFAWFTLRNV